MSQWRSASGRASGGQQGRTSKGRLQDPLQCSWLKRCEKAYLKTEFESDSSELKSILCQRDQLT